MERKNADDWDGVKVETLAKEYMNARREMWTILADRLGEKWQLIEQKVSSSIESNPFQTNTTHSAWRKVSRTSNQHTGRLREKREVRTKATAALATRTLSRRQMVAQKYPHPMRRSEKIGPKEEA